MSKWIWRFGEFEIWHNLLVHTRRQAYGFPEPPIWKVHMPDPVVRFVKETETEGGKIRIRALGSFTMMYYTGENYETESKTWGKEEVILPPGKVRIQILVQNRDSFPAIYVDGVVESDETWLASDATPDLRPVGCTDLLCDPEHTPDVFPFEYEEIKPVAKQFTEKGVIYDFGKEVMARTQITGLPTQAADESGSGARPVTVRFGESLEEVLDPVWCVVRFREVPENGTLEYPPYALRYLYIGLDEEDPQEKLFSSASAASQHDGQGDKNASDAAPAAGGGEWVDPAAPLTAAAASPLNPEAASALSGLKVSAQTEMLPLAQRGFFRAEGDDVLNRVFDVAAYTFHLNCREFIFDGIKRDRWVWSADAYQSLYVNHYLYCDPEIEKRTISALGGKPPIKEYINTIMDYSYFWILSILEYYKWYGDEGFLKQIFPQAQEIMNYCLGRRSEDGLIRGREEDWVFIDWAPMDKTGALCGEQILLAAALAAYAEIGAVVGMPKGEQNQYRADAKAVQALIQEKFYDKELGVFVDSYESGKRNVTRQSNILAYLYLPCTDEQKKNIYERVVCNDNVIQITTPYFKFYENQVHCMEGNGSLLEESIHDYYGSMLDLGATTLYEQYDPNDKGAEHFAMYGRPFEKSLCHAWSTSPIYLLGAYRAGVRNTGVAFSSFEVRPNPGTIGTFHAVVPVPGGSVTVDVVKYNAAASASNGDAADKYIVTVLSTISGGTLYFAGEEKVLPAGEAVTIAEG